MKQIRILLTLLCLLVVVPGMAQDVSVETFESYTDLTSLKAKWAVSTSRNDEIALGTDGGANSTSNYLVIKDEGYGITVTGTDLVSPAPGNYKLAFYYKNGQELQPLNNVKVKLLQDSLVRTEISIPFIAQSAWTYVESGIVHLTGSAVTIQVSASNAAGTPNQTNLAMALDELNLVLVPDPPLELSVFPDDRIYLSRTKTITATPAFGSGTYTKLEVDIENNGTIDFTDTTEPFEFTWDTLQNVAQDTSRTLDAESSNTPISVKFTLTDSNNNSVSVVEDYTVDNRFTNGRESLITNSDFSQWQPETSSTFTLPVGWTDQWTTSTYPEVGPGAGRNAEAGDALKIKLGKGTAGLPDNPDRYVLHSDGKKGNYRDLQTYFWGKGSYARLYYFVSNDGGITYANSFKEAAKADGVSWTRAVGPVVKTVGLGKDSYVALATHQLGTTEHFWDDIVSEAILIPITSEVDGWKLY